MATLTTSYQQIASKLIGTISGSGVSTKSVYLRIYAKYTSQSIVDNKSFVSYKSTLYVTGDGTYFYTGSTTTKTLSGTGATSVSADAQGNYYVGETTLCETTGTVTHAADGTANVSTSASWASTPWGVSGSTSSTDALPTIPRATTPTLSASTATMGNSITITMNPASSSFKHKLRYRWLSDTKNRTSGLSIGADFTTQGNTTATFTIPTALANEIPSSNSGSGTIYCYTYNSSGTHIGTKTVSFTANVPSYTPTISGISLTGNKLLSGAYVQGKSTVTVDTTASSSYGATIKSYSTTLDGKTYTSKNFTSSVLSSGSKSAVVKVTDSRGKTASLTSSAITVYAYVAPTITSFTLVRDSTTPTTVVATVKGSISAINNKNTKGITVTLNGVTNTITSSSYTIDGTTTFTDVSTDNSFTGVAKIADYYTSASKSVVLPTVAVTMDFYKDGDGIAMGKVAEQGDLLDVAWSVNIGGSLNVKEEIKTEKSFEVDSSTFGPMMIKRNDSANAAAIKFANTNGVLGAIGMTQTADGGLRRWTADTSGTYFVLDTGNLTNYIKDYVIEQGTSNGWNYTKWKNGKIELYGDKSLTFPDGTTMTTNLFRSIVTLDLSDLLSKILYGSCPYQKNGMIPQVCRNSTTQSKAEIVIATSRTITSFTDTIPLYIVGEI